MKAGLYARVSREEQAEGYSIDEQLHAMREFCKTRKWDIAALDAIEDQSIAAHSAVDGVGLRRARGSLRARRLAHAVGDFGDFQDRIDLNPDAPNLAGRFQCCDE